MTQCENMIEGSGRPPLIAQCKRTAVEGERFCAVCKAAKARGEARSDKAVKDFIARHAGVHESCRIEHNRLAAELKALKTAAREVDLAFTRPDGIDWQEGLTREQRWALDQLDEILPALLPTKETTK